MTPRGCSPLGTCQEHILQFNFIWNKCSLYTVSPVMFPIVQSALKTGKFYFKKHSKSEVKRRYILRQRGKLNLYISEVCDIVK